MGREEEGVRDVQRLLLLFIPQDTFIYFSPLSLTYQTERTYLALALVKAQLAKRRKKKNIHEW